MSSSFATNEGISKGDLISNYEPRFVYKSNSLLDIDEYLKKIKIIII